MTARIVCFGEMLLRVGAPAGTGPLLQAPAVEVHVGGAEANVAASLARFGDDAAMVTVVPEHALGQACIAALARHGVDTRWVRRSPERIGLYFLDGGGPLLPAQVLYDRAHSGFALADPAGYDWNAILAGAAWLHVGGITAALGSGARAALTAAMACATRTGVRISFDCNYRPSLWRGREAEGIEVLRTLVAGADLVFAGAADVQLLFGGEAPTTEAPEAAFAHAARTLLAACPRLALVATTARVVHAADQHELTGLVADRRAVCSSRRWSIRPVVDRIGSGDAFAAGLLHRLAGGASAQECVEFAAAAAALKHGVRGDMSPYRVADVTRLLTLGSGDVQR